MKLRDGDGVAEESPGPEVKGAASAATEVEVELLVLVLVLKLELKLVMPLQEALNPLLLALPMLVIDDVDVATSSSTARPVVDDDDDADDVSVGGLLVPFPITASDSSSKLSPLSSEWAE